jgi:hypothetical protein
MKKTDREYPESGGGHGSPQGEIDLRPFHRNFPSLAIVNERRGRFSIGQEPALFRRVSQEKREGQDDQPGDGSHDQKRGTPSVMDDQIGHSGHQKTGKADRRIINAEDTASFFYKPFAQQRVADGRPGAGAPSAGDHDDGGVEMQRGTDMTQIDEPGSHDEPTREDHFSGTDPVQEISHDGGRYPRLQAVNGESAGNDGHAPGQFLDDGFHKGAEAVIIDAVPIGRKYGEDQGDPPAIEDVIEAETNPIVRGFAHHGCILKQICTKLSMMPEFFVPCVQPWRPGRHFDML